MNYKIHKDGSFDLNLSGGDILGAYPHVNGKPVRPQSVIVNERSARYEIGQGYVELKFCVNDSYISIDASFAAIGSPHDIEPIGGAEAPGLGRAFCQGFGIGGPTGVNDISDESAASLLSHGLIALKAEKWLFIHARDHRRFKNVYQVAKSPAIFGASSVKSVYAGFVTECVVSQCDLPRIYISEADSLYDGLCVCANEIADFMGARRASRPEFHWCSWYYSYHLLDQERLNNYVKEFKRQKESVPFRYIQIDAGYFPSVGDWLEPYDRFPDGLQESAKVISDAGYGAGIWIGPFMVGDESRVFGEHPEWMLKNKDGSYVRRWKQYNEPKVWGYRDCDYYVLDTSHPGAMEYLRNVFTTMRKWGYTLYKTDFMLWSMADSSEVDRYVPGKTSFEYYREVLDMIRSCIGEESSWLGCIAPFLPSLGYMDMMRIGGDVGAQWEKHGFGPINMIREIVGDSYFNHVYWTNDPDATMLRDFHIHLKPAEVESLALLQAVSGGLITTSDPIHLMAPDRQELLRFIVPKGIYNPILPCLEDSNPVIVMLHELKQGWLAFFMNPTDQAAICPCEWVKWLGDDSWRLRKRHGGSAAITDVPYVKIASHECCLYFVSREEICKEPENLWEW